MRKAMVVNATLITAPYSTKKRSKDLDLKMQATKRGKALTDC
jgi:hypothetical protein